MQHWNRDVIVAQHSNIQVRKFPGSLVSYKQSLFIHYSVSDRHMPWRLIRKANMPCWVQGGI